MKYHDHHLRGYSVADYGKTITLELVDSLSPAAEVSIIRFSEVIAYNFTHLGGAIITDIFETSFLDAAKETGFDLSKAQKKLGGLPFDASDISACQGYFTKHRFKIWLLISAIGFTGLIVAKETQQAD